MMYPTQRLADVSDDIRYGLTASAATSGTHRFIRISEITDSGQLKSSGMKYVTPDPSSTEKFSLRPGDLLIARSGSVGRPYLVSETLKAVFASYLIRFRLRSDLVEPTYVFYYAQSPIYREYIVDTGRGAAIKNINAKQLGELQLPVPPLEEQRRIVARIKECMERVEEIEHLRMEALAEADYLAPSLYAALQDGGRWPCMAVGDVITESRNGRSIPQTNQNANGYVLSLSAVRDISLDLDQKKPILLSDSIEAQYSIKAGDVFVSRSNTRELVGLASVATENPQGRVIYPDLLIKLVAKPDVVMPRFLAYALRTAESRRQIKDRSVGTSQSMVEISGQRLREVKISVPPLNVQAELIEKFDELHVFSSDIMVDLRSLNSSALRQSILQKAFAGEL